MNVRLFSNGLLANDHTPIVYALVCVSIRGIQSVFQMGSGEMAGASLLFGRKPTFFASFGAREMFRVLPI